MLLPGSITLQLFHLLCVQRWGCTTNLNPIAGIGHDSVGGENRQPESLTGGRELMKKITILVLVVLMLAVTAVPAFAHPDASDAGLANAEGKAGTSPTGGNPIGRGAAFGNLGAHNPLCGAPPDPADQ